MDAKANFSPDIADYVGICSIGLTQGNLDRAFALVALEPAIPVAPSRRERLWRFWAGLYAAESRPTTGAL